MPDHPTEFELITAVAMLYFGSRCDIVVLEVGLGGGLDASNVIDVPEAAVITAMGMDHAAILGPTLADIAAAKAGIIKPGGAVVSCGGCPEADAVIRQRCREQGAALTEGGLHPPAGSPDGPCRYGAGFCPPITAAPAAGGALPVRNAAVAITVVEVLRQKGWNISDEALRQGLSAVRWPGRLEVLRRADPVILRDGAHNAHGMAATVESLKALFPGKKAGDPHGRHGRQGRGGHAESAPPIAEAVVTVRPDSPRAMGAAELAALVRRRGVPTCACESVEEGLRIAAMAAGQDGVVCALGSLYLAADAPGGRDAVSGCTRGAVRCRRLFADYVHFSAGASMKQGKSGPSCGMAHFFLRLRREQGPQIPPQFWVFKKRLPFVYNLFISTR